MHLTPHEACDDVEKVPESRRIAEYDRRAFFAAETRRKKSCLGTSQKYQAVSRFVRPGATRNDS